MRSTSIPARWCFPAAPSIPAIMTLPASPNSTPAARGFTPRRLGFGLGATRETFEESGILLAKPHGSNDLVSAARAAEISTAFRAAPDEDKKFEKIFSDNGKLPTP